MLHFFPFQNAISNPFKHLISNFLCKRANVSFYFVCACVHKRELVLFAEPCLSIYSITACKFYFLPRFGCREDIIRSVIVPE